MRAQAAYDALGAGGHGHGRHGVSVLPLELADLRTVKAFARGVLEELGGRRLDYLFLNAGMASDASKAGPRGSRWCEPFLVNHLCKRQSPSRIMSSHDGLVCLYVIC